MDDVKAEWAHGLGMFSFAEVGKALDHCLDHSKFPPTLPEFKTLCRDLRQPEFSNALPRKFTEEEREAGQAKLQQATDQLTGRKDYKDWARKIMQMHENGDPVYDLSLRFAREALGIKGEIEAAL